MSRLLFFFGGGKPLDDTFYGGWSLRKLRSAYSGSCIQVRRSSDNALQDIGFDGSGNLDTASLISFVGAGSGFVRTFYNQSATASLDFVQTTNANQPRIVNAATLETLNGKPSLYFSGSTFMQVPSSTSLFNFLHNGGLGCVSCVFNGNTAASRVFYGNFGNAFSRVGIGFGIITTNALLNRVTKGVAGAANAPVANSTSNNVISNNTSHLSILYLDADNATASQRSLIYIDNGSAIANNTLTNAPSTANAFANFSIGEDGVGTNRLIGFIPELIVYNKHPDLTLVRPNQLNFYAI